MRASAAWSAVVALGLQGCTGGACSDVGGFDGVGVEISRALFVSTGNVAVEVCDADACATATQRLGPVPEGAVGRGANVTFDDLGRRFEPGSVVVTVRLSDADGTLFATAERDVELSRSYPNGESCDGDGYVVGTVTLGGDDRL
jgi:predicted metallo-beta-lactamase superfamily hydrolase